MCTLQHLLQHTFLVSYFCVDVVVSNAYGNMRWFQFYGKNSRSYLLNTFLGFSRLYTCLKKSTVDARLEKKGELGLNGAKSSRMFNFQGKTFQKTVSTAWTTPLVAMTLVRITVDSPADELMVTPRQSLKIIQVKIFHKWEISWRKITKIKLWIYCQYISTLLFGPGHDLVFN